MEIKCEYCGSMIPETVEQCPYCGASNNSIKRTADGTPKTIAELAKWYEDRHLPPYEITRFFIGIDYRQPRAFGIYQDGNEFIVYKNKADGTRAVRYKGTDEAYAVNELYLKLKDEILNQKAHQQKHTNEDFVQETKKMFSDTFSYKNVNEYIIKPSIAMVIGIVMFIVLIIVGFALNDTFKGIGWDLLISGIAGIVGTFFLTDFIENHKRFKPFGMYAAWLKKPKGSAMRHAMHYFITVLLIALVLITPIHNYCKTDYFKYNDTVYVNSHYSWFEYDDDSYDIMKSAARLFHRRFWITNLYMALTIQIWCGTARLSNLKIAAIMKTIMRAQAARAVIMTAIMSGIPVIAGIQVAVTGIVTGDYCIT